MLSQPSTFVSVKVAELLEAVYVFPSIQVYELQAITSSVLPLELLTVKCNVSTCTQLLASELIWVKVPLVV